jgi:hypothetical protein
VPIHRQRQPFSNWLLVSLFTDGGYAVRGKIMKISTLGISLIGLFLASTASAGDLPQMGYVPKISVKELTAKGYRWVTANGPYGCTNEQTLRKITSERTDLTELSLVEDGSAYYLIPGTLVRIVRDDPASGASEILVGGIIKRLWTYNRFLTARPIHDIYGIVETPDTAGLIDPSDAAEAGLVRAGPTPREPITTTPQSVQQGIAVK